MSDHPITTAAAPLSSPMTSPFRTAADWLASALSMAAALGLVNLAVGVLSALWLATQLYRFWRFEVHTLRRRSPTSTTTPDKDLP